MTRLVQVIYDFFCLYLAIPVLYAEWVATETCPYGIWLNRTWGQLCLIYEQEPKSMFLAPEERAGFKVHQMWEAARPHHKLLYAGHYLAVCSSYFFALAWYLAPLTPLFWWVYGHATITWSP